MPRDRRTLADVWTREDGARTSSLQEARLCSKLTKPWTVPDAGTTQDTELQQNYQSLGAYGINNLEGKLVTGLWPPMLPSFKLVPAAKVAFDPALPPDMLEKIYAELFRREVLIQSVLESAGARAELRGRQSGFRTQIRKAISNLLITGDTLVRMKDDFQLRVFRRDHYTTRRDPEGNVIFHMTEELLDPMVLSDKQLESIAIKREDISGAHEGDLKRELKLHTRIEWQPQTKKWLIEQEANGKTIPLGKLNEEKDLASEETISPYFSVPYELVTGEHYGRGFVELNKADLRSLDRLTQYMIEWAGLCAKATPAIDETSTLTAEDINLPNGEPIRCRFANGQPVDIAFLKVDKMQDLSFIREVIADLRGNVGKVMLVASASVRNSERTTAFEIQQTNLRELDEGLSGSLPAIADHFQLPIIHKAIDLLTRKGVMKPLPDNAVDVQILTGIAALAKTAKVQDLLNVGKIIKEIGPAAEPYVKLGNYIQTIMRYMNLYEPQAFRTEEEAQQWQQQQQEMLLKQKAAEQAVSTAGTLVENKAAAQGAPAQGR